MRHRVLTCKNHPNLRWSCKDIAWDASGYNGMRLLFFSGTSRKGIYSDGSGLDCTTFLDGNFVGECSCTSKDLVLVPEDAEVKQ